MRLYRVAIALGLGLLFTGCSPIGPISRDQLAANLAPILEVENRAKQVLSGAQMLGSVGVISEKDAGELKVHYDVYFVYHNAANVYLAGGDIESYIAHIQTAKQELDTMEAILKHSLVADKRFSDFSGYRSFDF